MNYLSKTALIVVCFMILGTPFLRAQEKQKFLFEIKVNRKAGFIDHTGKIVIEPKLNGAYEFSEGLAAAYIGNGQFDEGYIDETGTVAIEPGFNVASKFSEGFAWVGIDPNRKPYKLGPLTLYTSPASDSFDYNIGFIDKTGKWIAEPVYTLALDFSEGLAAVRAKDNKWGFIDTSGRLKIAAKFDWAQSFSNGRAVVFAEGKYGFIDKSGHYVVKPKYTNALDFSEGLACVKIGGRVREPGFGVHTVTTGNRDLRYGYIDVNGKVVFQITASDCRQFSEGFARIEMGGKWGFIDKRGKIVIDPQVDALSDFSEGLARVLLSDKKSGFGFINRSGKIVIKSQFPFVEDFKNGLARVADSLTLYDAKFGYIDKFGRVIWEPTK